MAAREVYEFLLSAKDKASPVFDKVGKSASKSLSGVEKDATKAGTAASTGFGSSFKKGMGSLGSMGLDKFLAVGAVTGAVKFAISAASDLQESVSKSNAVFRENAGEVQKWAATAATSFGQSKAQALEAAGTFGNLFQAFGVGLEPATKMSTTLTELASDLASFNNTSVQEAIEALRSGLSGETEPLKRYGVALTDARLKQEALGLGLISDVKKPLDAAAKSQAAYSLIMKDTALAQGDFERTSTGYANSMRTLQATVTDAAAALGTQLLPALSDLAQIAAKGIDLVVKIKTVEGDKGGLGGFIDKALAEVSQSAGGIIKDFWAHATTGTAPWEEVDKYKNAVEGTVNAFDRATDSKNRGAAASQRLAAVEATATAASLATAGAKRAEYEATQRVVDALHAENDALAANVTAQLAVYDSTFAVTDAQNRFTVAAYAANSTVDDGSTVLNEQTLAQDEAARAALGAAAAAVRQAEDQATLKGSTLSAKDATKIQIDTLSALAAKIGGPVAEQIMGMVGDLKRLDQTNADPDATLNDKASGPIGLVGTKVNLLNGQSATVHVNANTGAANAALSRVYDRLRSLSLMNVGTFGLAGGASNWRGGWTMVGEEGPELVNLPRGSDVYTAGETSRMMTAAPSAPALPAGGSGGGATVVNFNGTFLTSKAELGRMVDEAVAESRRRGNRAA